MFCSHSFEIQRKIRINFLGGSPIGFFYPAIPTQIFPSSRTLHTEPAPAVRAAVKTVLSCQSFALSPETVHFGCACRSTPVERKRLKSLFAKLTQINTLSIRFCRLLTLDSKIPAWIRLRLVRKSTNKSQSTTAYIRILLADNPSLLTKNCHKMF